jgi:hypothetical protein
MSKTKKTMKNSIFWLVLCLAFPALLRAQAIKLPPEVESLSAKAKETVEVNMDGPMLHWASKFLSAEDADEKKAAKLVANLKSIYVRSFEFDQEGAYSSADVDALRARFQPPVWSRAVGVRSEREGDNVDVFFKLENDQVTGIVVIAAERKELTFVNIVGPLDVDQLADLGGEFGIPKLKTKPSKHVAKVEKGDHK